MRNVRGLFVPFLVLALLMSAVSSSGASEAPAGQMTWAVHISLAPTWFDPAETSGIITPFMVLYALHDAVLKPLPGQLMTPSLAESWSMSPDGLVYEDETCRMAVQTVDGLHGRRRCASSSAFCCSRFATLTPAASASACAWSSCALTPAASTCSRATVCWTAASRAARSFESWVREARSVWTVAICSLPTFSAWAA